MSGGAPRVVLILTCVLVGALVMSSAFMMLAMGMGMGGHMAMMGGRGSDPAGETPVVGVTEVAIEDFAFSPANIVVDVGTTVTWTNEDRVRHTVTSDDGDVLDSPLLGRNETFSYTFETPGQYAYHCAPHPNMQGLVTVRASGGP
jgi:plastocyanin